MENLKLEDVLARFMDATSIKSLQEVASAIGVSSNSLSGWKARNSIGIAFEYMSKYLLSKNISIYYVFFGIGPKMITPDELYKPSELEKRVERLERLIVESK
jgi:hypothetical protein